MEKMRILLVDDHILFRKGIATLLGARSDITIVSEASDGIEAVEIARQTKPDVILLDVHMPNRDGIETVSILKEELPEVKIVMLTVSDDDNDLFRAIKNGATGYLLKNLEPHTLYNMLDGIRRGDAPISRAMAAKILQEFSQSDDVEEAAEVDELTPREMEVLELVVTGVSNKEIGETLHITENTVKIHLRNILDKLHVQNRVQAAVHAVRKGLIDDSANVSEEET